MRHGAFRACGLVLFAVLGSRAARADPVTVQQALAAYEQGQLTQALQGLEAALRAGGNGRADLAVLYAHLAVLRAGSGDDAGALAASRAALDLDPAIVPPGDASPLALVPFARAREGGSGAVALELALTGPATCPRGAPCILSARVVGDTSGIARALRVQVIGGGSALVEGSFPLELRLPPGTTDATDERRYFAELLDEHGSVLASVGSSTAPRALRIIGRREADREADREAPTPAGPHPRRERSRRESSSLLASPWFWVVAGGVVAGLVTGTVLATSGGSGRANLSPVEVEVR